MVAAGSVRPFFPSGNAKPGPHAIEHRTQHVCLENLASGTEIAIAQDILLPKLHRVKA